MPIKRFLFTTDVEDNLTSTYSDVPLSAKQGKILDEKKLDAPSSAKAGTILIHNGTKWTQQDGYGYIDGFETVFDGDLSVPEYTGTWTDVCAGTLQKGKKYRVEIPDMSFSSETEAYIDGEYTYLFSEKDGEPTLSPDSPLTLREKGGNIQVAAFAETKSTRMKITTYDSIVKIDSKLLPEQSGTSWSGVTDKPFSSVNEANGCLAVLDDELSVVCGDTVGTVCAGDDARLSDSRNPTSHANSHVNGDDVIQDASTSQSGLLSATDWNTFNDKQDKHTTSTGTLRVDGWDSTTKTQTISVVGVTASNTAIISPSGDSYIEYGTKGVRCTGQSEGALTFACEEVPDSYLDINVVILN